LKHKRKEQTKTWQNTELSAPQTQTQFSAPQTQTQFSAPQTQTQTQTHKFQLTILYLASTNGTFGGQVRPTRMYGA